MNLTCRGQVLVAPQAVRPPKLSGSPHDPLSAVLLIPLAEVMRVMLRASSGVPTVCRKHVTRPVCLPLSAIIRNRSCLTVVRPRQHHLRRRRTHQSVGRKDERQTVHNPCGSDRRTTSLACI